MPELSVIIPVKNEEGNILPLAGAIHDSLINISYEVIWVNDGSSDKSAEEILSIPFDDTTLVELEKNYGQSIAMKAGIDQSRGKYIAFLDGDGQNDPADIPGMLQMLRDQNLDMVSGYRKDRKDNFWLRRLPSNIA